MPSQTWSKLKKAFLNPKYIFKGKPTYLVWMNTYFPGIQKNVADEILAGLLLKKYRLSDEQIADHLISYNQKTNDIQKFTTDFYSRDEVLLFKIKNYKLNQVDLSSYNITSDVLARLILSGNKTYQSFLKDAFDNVNELEKQKFLIDLDYCLGYLPHDCLLIIKDNYSNETLIENTPYLMLLNYSKELSEDIQFSILKNLLINAPHLFEQWITSAQHDWNTRNSNVLKNHHLDAWWNMCESLNIKAVEDKKDLLRKTLSESFNVMIQEDIFTNQLA